MAQYIGGDEPALVEHWDDEPVERDGHPLIATIIGGLVILLGSSGLSGIHHTGSPLAGAIGGATAIALTVWGVAFAITIRHASVVWRIASFALLWLLALLATLFAIGQANMDLRADVAAVSEYRIGPDGNLIIPEGGTGPVSRLMRSYARDLQASQKMLADRLDPLRIDLLMQPAELTRNPSFLRDCSRFGRHDEAIDQAYERETARMGRFRREIASIDVSEDFKRGMIASIEQERPRALARSKRSGEVLKLQLREAYSMCTILARHRWKAAKGKFMFTNDGDLVAFNTHGGVWDGLVREQEALQQERRAGMESGQNTLRNALK